MNSFPEKILLDAARALVESAEWNIYYTAKGHRPHIENPEQCVKVVLHSCGVTENPDPWKSEAACDALNETVSERMRGYEVELLNAPECVLAVTEAYRNAPADPARTAPSSKPAVI